MNALNKVLFALYLSIIIVPNLYGQAVDSDQKAPNYADSGKNYAMLIRNINHLNAAIKTVNMLTEKNREAVDQFEVVICGKTVTKLKTNADLINKAKQSGITLSVCGMSMNKFSITKEDLSNQVGIVPNGLIRIFELQEQGYYTITL